MAIIDADWWTIRRKFSGSAGASQAMSRGPLPVYQHRVPYLRRKPCSCNPSTTRQLAARARWAYIAWAWNNVLAWEDRDDWNNFAGYPSVRWYDEEQQYRRLTGYEWYCGLNARCLAVGLELCPYPYTAWYGSDLSLLELELLTSTRIRVTFAPEPEDWQGLLVYGRGPMGPGCHAVVPECNWWRDSVPSRWFLIGFGGLGVHSPVELDLPVTIRPGRKLAVMGVLMGGGGWVSDDWLVEHVTATP